MIKEKNRTKNVLCCDTFKLVTKVGIFLEGWLPTTQVIIVLKQKLEGLLLGFVLFLSWKQNNNKKNCLTLRWKHHTNQVFVSICKSPIQHFGSRVQWCIGQLSSLINRCMGSISFLHDLCSVWLTEHRLHTAKAFLFKSLVYIVEVFLPHFPDDRPNKELPPSGITGTTIRLHTQRECVVCN